MFKFSRVDFMQIKEYIILNLAVISFYELFSIIMGVLYFYHIRCQSLDVVIYSISKNIRVFTYIMLAIPYINLSERAKNLTIKFTLCLISADLIFSYIFGLINSSMIWTNEVIIRCGIPFALIGMLTLLITIKVYNTKIFVCGLTTFFIIGKYITYFFPEITNTSLVPYQYFWLEKTFQFLVIAIFYILYFIESEDDTHYYEDIQ